MKQFANFSLSLSRRQQDSTRIGEKPIKLTEPPAAIDLCPPGKCADAEAIFEEIGYDAARIASRKKSVVIR